ncbi:MAG: sodium/solute symporter [Paludibacteraceae bacterium]|nr:sodium/solute symporter [Paludibacteraceae bacterium]
MKNNFTLLLIFQLFLVSCQSDNSANSTNIQWKQVTPINQSNGLSAVYSGINSEGLIIAGGCNFPNTPAAEGGVKEFYDDIIALKDGRWQGIAKLPVASAYGASVNIGDDIYMIGGTQNGVNSLQHTFKLSGKTLSKLSDMPEGKDNMGGAAIGTDIYIVGGLSNGKPSNEVYCYDTKKDKWRTIIQYPGEPRVQPVVVAQNAAEEKRLYLIGGYNPITKNIMTDGWCYSPGNKEWYPISDIPVGANGGIGFASGVHAIIVTGGVNKERFSQGLNIKTDSSRKEYMTQDPEWYKFNDATYAYNTITDRWCKNGNIPVARAGAAVVTGDGGWYIVLGETMPGVRSDQVWHGKTESLHSFGWINWSVIAIYLVAMIGMGIFFMFRAKSSEDFFKASGRIPWWAVSVSIFATMLSAITFMAIPAKTYATDWRYFLMAVTIFIVAFPVVKYYLPFFRRLNITSAYEYLEFRFNSTLRIVSSVLFIVFMTARMALVLYLPSLALTAATGIDIYICILMMSIITIIYSSIGGIEAVVWGDVVQGIILMGGALFTLGFLIFNTDGNFLQIAIENDKFNIFDFSFDITNATFWVVILGGIANQMISYTSDQTVIQRYMTVKNEKQAGKSIITNGVLSLISSALFYTIGTALFTYFQSRPETLDIAMPTADSIFPFFIMTQLPVGIAGILIAAIFAASMSTVSSNINSISTAYTVDIHPRISHRTTDNQKLRAARIASIVFGVLGCGFALMMATWNVLSLFDWFNSMLGLLTSGLGALFFMGIFFDRIDGHSALIGFISGTIILLIITIYTNVNFMLYGFIGIIIITAISLIFSFILPQNNKNINGLTWKLLSKK